MGVQQEQRPVLRLASVTEPTAIPHALASSLGLEAVRGDVLAACVAILGDGPGLLVIDNCEHLLDAARGVVGEILADLVTDGRTTPAADFLRLARLASVP